MKFTLKQSLVTGILAIALVVSGYGAGLWQGYQTGHANGYSSGYESGSADSRGQFYRGIWYACVIVEITMFGVPPDQATPNCLSAVPQWIANQDYETNTPEWVWPPK